MNYSGDAAEQVVRFSLEGMEVAMKITGTAAKEMAILLAAALRAEQKTAGKARLSSMLKSGKELTVFSLPQKDIKKFVQEARKYGVLYCTIRDRQSKDPNAVVAETIAYDKLMEVGGSLAAAKEKGFLRSEGKEYVMKDGDVVNFLPMLSACTDSPRQP